MIIIYRLFSGEIGKSTRFGSFQAVLPFGDVLAKSGDLRLLLLKATSVKSNNFSSVFGDSEGMYRSAGFLYSTSSGCCHEIAPCFKALTGGQAVASCVPLESPRLNSCNDYVNWTRTPRQILFI